MKRLFIASAALLPAWGAAAAQDSQDIRVRLGLGAQLQPEFIGGDGTRVAPLFHVNLARGTNEFKFSAPDDSPAIAVVSKDGFSFGPAANVQWSRRNSDVGAPVGKVPTT